jgi:hypothetical protein
VQRGSSGLPTIPSLVRSPELQHRSRLGVGSGSSVNTSTHRPVVQHSHLPLPIRPSPPERVHPMTPPLPLSMLHSSPPEESLALPKSRSLRYPPSAVTHSDTQASMTMKPSSIWTLFEI